MNTVAGSKASGTVLTPGTHSQRPRASFHFEGGGHVFRDFSGGSNSPIQQHISYITSNKTVQANSANGRTRIHYISSTSLIFDFNCIFEKINMFIVKHNGPSIAIS
jgi:hypothetical protein